MSDGIATEVEQPMGTDSGAAAAPHGEDGGTSPGSVKDTIESILIAFILAFIFRAFVLEAFVIPTGSMAPTLLGAHMRFRCTDCGYQWDVNYSGRTDGEDVRIPPFAEPVQERVNGETVWSPRVFSVRCPNCGFKVPREDARDPDNDATSPPVRYGDRILVLKYIYLFGMPKRWDVVVFKTPSTDFDEKIPPYTINYIKRLVGRPGETVAVLDGDVYVKPGKDKPWEVQTKPRVVQDALWRVIYDNDYRPRGLPRDPRHGDYIDQTAGAWVQPWTVTEGPAGGERGWRLDGKESGDPRVFTFDDRGGSGTITFNPDANRDTHPFTDWMAYDITSYQQRGPVRADTYDTTDNMARNAVSDLKLDLFYERQEGDGPLRLMLTKRRHTFVAELTPTKARLLHRLPSGEEFEVAEAERVKPQHDGTEHVEFMNVDYQVTLRVDGRDVIRTTPQQYAPKIDELKREYEHNQVQPMPEVRLSAAGQRCRVSHLSLWRDIYYTSRRDGDVPLAWGTWSHPVRLYHKGEAIGSGDERYPAGPRVATDNEYFVLGDNSIISGDARYWENSVDLPSEGLEVGPGCVPGRFMLGKAFFVYWPAGFRPLGLKYAVCPNFGEMRFIH